MLVRGDMRLRIRRRRGLSLIELVVVISILSLLMTAVAVYAVGIGRDTKVSIAKNELESIGQALDSYFTLTGRYPESFQPLGDRRILKRLPVDPWGNPFSYRLVNGTPTIGSLGADGLVGGEGDAADLSTP